MNESNRGSERDSIDQADLEVEAAPAESAGGCPLSRRDQTRNIVIYAANWALVYLSSPVTYVGLVQAALLDRLGFGSREANLPAGVFLWSMPLAVLVIWFFPRVQSLKRLMVGAVLAAALTGGLAAVSILWLGPNFVLAALVAYAAVWGCANGIFASCQWEMLGRGVAESRRGEALALAFGAGPVLAVVASIGSQAVLGGSVRELQSPIDLPRIEYPWNFAGLYLASVLILGLAAVQSSFFVVPESDSDPERRPFLPWMFGGLTEFLGSRLILTASIAYILVYSGHEVMQNIALYTREAVGESPEKYAGLQLTLRFSFKIAAGFFLGWLLVRSNPRTLLLATAALIFAGVLWALMVPGPWFLLSFGVLGAGELFGVYYPNYILDCSPRSELRRNMVFTSMIVMPVGFAPILFGLIADLAGRTNRALGFQASFAAALAVLAAAMILVRVALPPRPAVVGEERSIG